MDEAKDTAVICRCVSAHAASLGVAIAPEELAELAVRHDMGTSEIAALNAVFAYLADKRHDQVIETLLRLSRLPQKAPKTFASFDFDRNTRAGRGGAAQAAGAREPARAQEPGVHRARRHREDAPGPGLRVFDKVKMNIGDADVFLSQNLCCESQGSSVLHGAHPSQ